VALLRRSGCVLSRAVLSRVFPVAKRTYEGACVICSPFQRHTIVLMCMCVCCAHLDRGFILLAGLCCCQCVGCLRARLLRHSRASPVFLTAKFGSPSCWQYRAGWGCFCLSALYLRLWLGLLLPCRVCVWVGVWVDCITAVSAVSGLVKKRRCRKRSLTVGPALAG
jgi:hypothetical protein